MQSAMRSSGPRPQMFGSMRPSSQLPRMTASQRVGKSPNSFHLNFAISGVLAKCTENVTLVSDGLCCERGAINFCGLGVTSCLLLYYCSHPNHGSPDSHHRSFRNSQSRTGGVPVQVCHRSTQHPATCQHSAAGHRAAGRTATFSRMKLCPPPLCSG